MNVFVFAPKKCKKSYVAGSVTLSVHICVHEDVKTWIIGLQQQIFFRTNINL